MPPKHLSRKFELKNRAAKIFAPPLERRHLSSKNWVQNESGKKRALLKSSNYYWAEPVARKQPIRVLPGSTLTGCSSTLMGCLQAALKWQQLGNGLDQQVVPLKVIF